MVSLNTENWVTKINSISNETEHYHNVKHEFKAKKFADKLFKNQYKQSWLLLLLWDHFKDHFSSLLVCICIHIHNLLR